MCGRQSYKGVDSLHILYAAFELISHVLIPFQTPLIEILFRLSSF